METRIIKFRGKRVDNGEWIYGYFFIQKDMNWYCIIDENADQESFQIIPETVGQYCGLKDKNNKEIYEGDLLISDGIVYEANWKGCLYGRSKIGYPLACDNSNRIKEKFEIIGNIYETPHLIKNPIEK